MPKYRQLHTKIIESFDFNEMPDDFTRVVWMLLFLTVDSEGRGVDNMAWVKSKLFPLRTDVQLEQLAAAFAWLAARQMIVRYEAHGRRYFFVPTFKNYQSGTQKEADSLLPAPDPLQTSSGATPALVVVAESASASESVYESESESESGEIEEIDKLPDNPPDDGDPEFSLIPLSKAFVEAAGLPELSGGAQKYTEALVEMRNKGVQPEDLRQGIQELRAKNYTIVSPHSCVTAAINCMGKRKGKKTGRQPDEAEVITEKMKASVAAHPDWYQQVENDEEGEK